jgi:hypothetical protein
MKEDEGRGGKMKEYKGMKGKEGRWGKIKEKEGK